MKVTNCCTNRKSRMNTSMSIVISGYYGLKAEKILCNNGSTIEEKNITIIKGQYRLMMQLNVWEMVWGLMVIRVDDRKESNILREKNWRKMQVHIVS